MFLFHGKKRRKTQKTLNFYRILSGASILAGIVIGIFNYNTDISYMLPESVNSAYLFKFSLIKHSVVLILIFINSFSILGIPLNISVLIISGYFISVSNSTLYINENIDKFQFVISEFPHTALNLAALFFLAEAAFEFSNYLFAFVMKACIKNNFTHEFKNLMIKFTLGLITVALAAFFETIIL